MATMQLKEFPKIWRTVRHLKPSQVGWRLRYFVQRRLVVSPRSARIEPATYRIDSPHQILSPPHFFLNESSSQAAYARLTELQTGRLTLLNQEFSFAGGDDWHFAGDYQHNRLRNFTLHYHGWMCDLATGYRQTRNPAYLSELRRWLVDWLTACPLHTRKRNAFAWNSYNIAQRLWHWREITSTVPAHFWNHEELPYSRFLNSVREQADVLSRHLEWDLRGNHLIKDAVGLAAAADLLGSSAPSRWVSQATSIANSQITEQILSDGMHFERSPMYHIHVLEDFLALASLLQDQAIRDRLEDTCRRMADPLKWLKHPCGIIPLFNDAADQQVSSPQHMEAELEQRNILSPVEPPRGLRYFPSAGLVAWHGSPWTVFYDVGTVGPEYQPGHAHADSLSIELSYEGQRLVVDPGTYCYDNDVYRAYDRSTNAHNTVCLDDTNSSEVWHIFRVGRRAMPADVSVVNTEDGFTAIASHTGYDHLPGSPRHQRRVQLDGEQRLEIHDHITGTGNHRLEGGFLLSPDWSVTSLPNGWRLVHEAQRLRIEFVASTPVDLAVVNRPWHPEFGREVITKRLVWTTYTALPFRMQSTWIAEG